MKRLRIQDIARATGADFSGDGYITDVTTDSRKAGSGSLFVPIIGENMDGHDFIRAAFDNGAAFALSSRKNVKCDEKILYVDDTKLANIAIGGLYRDMFDIKVVAVTGSVGKTTTKDFIATVLSTRYNVLKSIGNKNNEMGLPETVLGLTDSHEIAVLEMGMSGLGEISALSVSVKPDVAVITNVHGVHLEYLGSIENVLRAKLEVVEGMKPGAPLFLCGDNEILKNVSLPGVKCIFFGSENQNCDITACNVKDNGLTTTFDIRSVYGNAFASIPTTGSHLVLDALAAFGVGCALGLSPGESAAALSDYSPSGMRQRPVSFMGATVIEDCYNAAPVSMKGAIDTLKAMPCEGRRIAVFSDMLELGPTSKEEHVGVGRAVARAKLDKLLIWGKDARYYIEGADETGGIDCCAFDSKEALANTLRGMISPGDVVWVKGSRGMRLEEMLCVLYGGENHAR